MKAQNLIHILIGIVCLRVLPQAQAVTPAPTAAILAAIPRKDKRAAYLSSGGYNTVIGWFFFLSAVTTGAYNTGIGAARLY